MHDKQISGRHPRSAQIHYRVSLVYAQRFSPEVSG